MQKLLCVQKQFQILGPDPRGMNRPPVLFTPPGFTRNLSTPVAWEILSFGAWGWGAEGLTAFHMCFSRRVVSTVLETGICDMTLKKKKDVLLVLDLLCVCEVSLLY